MTYSGGGEGYLPLEYLVIYSVSVSPEALELDTPIVIVDDGSVTIVDPVGEVAIAAASLDADRSYVAVLVQGG